MNKLIRLMAVAALMAVPTVAQAQDVGTRGGVTGTRGAIPEYEPANNTSGGATPIDFNNRTTAVGILNLTSNDNDYFTITAAAGEIFSIFTVPLSTLPNGFNQADTVLEVNAPGGAFLVSSDDCGHTFPNGVTRRSSGIRFTATAAGTYTIRVRGFSAADAGRYGLLVSRLDSYEYTEETGATFAESAFVANQIAGPLVGFAVTGANDFDFYAVDLNPGDVLLAATCSTSDGTNLNDTNMDIRLFAPDQSTILVSSFSDACANSPAGGSFNTASTNPFILARANQTGTHYVQVTPTAGNTGADYRMITWVIPGTFCNGDADGSGRVVFLDVTTVLANFGNSCP